MIVVCVVILSVHSNCHPYTRPRANYAESVYLLVLCTLAIMQIVEDKNAQFYVSLVLLCIVSVHTLAMFFYKAGRFFRQRFKCCANGQTTAVDRRGYEELENTLTEESLDTEVERQRRVLDTIFSASGRDLYSG